MTALTPAEQKTFLTALLCSDGGLSSVKIDFKKFCQISGYKNEPTARVIYSKIRRKIEATAPEELLAYNGKCPGSPSKPSNEPNTPKKPRSPRVAKTPKSMNRVTGKTPLKDGEDENVSPLKRELFRQELERSTSPSPLGTDKIFGKEPNETLGEELKFVVNSEEESTAFI
ncbi:hypothetical protein KEM54_000699 [Ascosphaera aggregata]|nr:hypothetical protein KEM54_000699 [Ascosphaera aggregata]